MEFGGAAFSVFELSIFGPGEVIGVILTLVVLVFVFRSVVTAFIPLATALAGVAIGVLTLLAAGSVVTLDSTSVILAVMLGLAVGVDYALFIVSRHQRQVRAGVDPEESAGLAVGTAGSAVVFAGGTVVIGLAALAVVRIPFLTVMGLAAAGTVVISVLIAISLLPATLGLLGARIAAGAAGRTPRSRRRAPLGERWVAGVTRRRVPVLIAGVLGLLVFLIPAADLQLALPTDRSDNTAVRAQRLIDEAFGPGYDSPLVVVVQGSAAEAAAATTAEAVRELPGVAAVAPPQALPPGDLALINVIAAGGPDSERTKDLLAGIRQARGPIQAETGTRITVTGPTAVNIDMASCRRRSPCTAPSSSGWR
ncbi:MMPL family transporter [Nonomuraea sp. NPDC049421]|uniref:MMPL family transporter n=1 Tax=Nonomuraea sp. NPDC049421 TaxID=3155275 RepID=UPI003434D7F2